MKKKNKHRIYRHLNDIAMYTKRHVSTFNAGSKKLETE